MAALLSAKDLCKTYVIDKRQNNVLKNVNLEVNEGEMIAIMGPSGSGKSTLLYAISGMDRVTSGQRYKRGFRRTASARLHLPQYDELSETSLCG